MKRRIQPIAGVGAMLVALFACTWFLLASGPPERFSGVSSDGRVAVSGNAAASLGALTVTARDEAVQPFAARVGSAYDIAIGGRALPSGFLVVASYDEADIGSIAPNHLALYVFDRSANVWTMLPSVVDPSDRTVTATSSGANAILWTVAARP